MALQKPSTRQPFNNKTDTHRERERERERGRVTNKYHAYDALLLYPLVACRLLQLLDFMARDNCPQFPLPQTTPPPLPLPLPFPDLVYCAAIAFKFLPTHFFN